jgi:hypothetical protein
VSMAAVLLLLHAGCCKDEITMDEQAKLAAERGQGTADDDALSSAPYFQQVRLSPTRRQTIYLSLPPDLTEGRLSNTVTSILRLLSRLSIRSDGKES